jgi:hypothetical protein
MTLGLMLAVTPAGRPLADSVTGPVNPYSADTVTGKLVVCPNEREFGGPDVVTLNAGGGSSVRLNDVAQMFRFAVMQRFNVTEAADVMGLGAV